MREAAPARTATGRTRRIFYGWVLLAVLSLTATGSYGVLSYALPVLVASIEEELGWSRTAMTGAFSLPPGSRGWRPSR